MAEQSNISTHQLEELLDKTGAKFMLVSLAAKRARQLNDYANGLGRGTGRTIPPQVSDIAHKPLSIAFAEIAEEKIVAGEVEEAEAVIQEEETPQVSILDLQADIEGLDIFS